MHPHEWKLVSFQHFVGLRHFAAPAGPFRAYATRPTLCTQSHIDECHRHSVGPDWPPAGGRILPCTLMHALHTCATYLFFVSHPTGKTPCVMVEHAMLTSGGYSDRLRMRCRKMEWTRIVTPLASLSLHF